MSRPITPRSYAARPTELPAGATRSPWQQLVHQVRRFLPEGGSLSEYSWQRRHKAILILLWLHVVFVGAYGLVAGADIKQVFFGAFLMSFLGVVASQSEWSRGLRSGAASIALLCSSSLLVEFAQGLIEMHFHFFVMVSLIALYQDWLPFLLAIGYVFFEHALVGVINPTSVYNHAAAWADPLTWAGIHAIFVLSLSAVCVVNWNINETERKSTQSILDTAGEGIYGLDAANRVTFANPAALRMLGYTEKDLTGMSHTALLAAGSSFDLNTGFLNPESLETELLSAEDYKGDPASTYFRRKDGTAFPIEYLSAPTRMRDLSVGSVVTFRDITERLRTEEELKRSERYYRSLFENAHDAILLFDPTHEIVLDANAQACAMYGYTRDELVGTSLERISLDVDFGKQQVSQALETGFNLRFATKHCRRDGSMMHVDISASVINYMGRQAILSINHDSTDRVESAARIKREADRAKVLARVAARLNTRLDLDSLLQALCEELASAFNIQGASVSLLNEKRQVFVVESQTGLPENPDGKKNEFPLSLYTDFVQQHGNLIVVEDIRVFQGTGSAVADAAIESGMRGYAAVSMAREGQLLGLLSVFTTDAPRKLTEDELSLMQGIADQASQAIVNARLFMDAQRRLDFVQALHSIDVAISSSHDSRVTLEILLDKLLGQLKVDAADVLLLNPHFLTLEYAAGRGYRTDGVKRTRLKLGEGYAGQAALERRNVYVPDLRKATNFAGGAFLLAEEFLSIYCVPLVAKGNVLGVLRVFQRSLLDPDQEWIDYLEGFAGQAAIAVDNSTLFNDLQHSNVELALAYEKTLEGWSGALDLRDRETEGHTQRVTEMAVRLARALRVPESELVHMRRGALLHDIGKMGIPDSILLKPGPLTDEEWLIMKRHPVYAFELLSPIEFLQPALDIPYGHHEKWDGSGYPRGLKGEQIPFAARIFTVVDVWDALSSDRPYRAGWPHEKVREHITSLSGTHFDPVVVEAFLKMV